MEKFQNIEKKVNEIEEKLIGLKKIAGETGIDLNNELKEIEKKLEQNKDYLYSNLTRWNRVEIARHQGRPTTLDYIRLIFEDFIEFHGDRKYGDDLAVVCGIASFEGINVTIVGHQKGRNTKENIERNFGMPNPEGYRKALRHMELAEKFKRPIICFIDTAGAYPGIEAEERGQGQAIADNLYKMSSLCVPIISIVIGEGGSGGALAFGVSNTVIMMENSIYSVISPEGFASIIYKDSSKADLAADALKLTAQDLLHMNIIDGIIKEPQGGAHKDLKQSALNLKASIKEELYKLISMSPNEIVDHRYKKFRNIGVFEE